MIFPALFFYVFAGVCIAAAVMVIAARPRLDGDRLRRTDRLAEFAGDTALLAVGIAAQCVLAAKAW